MNGGMRIFVLAADHAEADRLDTLLWTFSQGSFVPHRLLHPDEANPATAMEPVLIGVSEPATPKGFDLLINLATSMPTNVDCYDRIAELVDGNEQRRSLGRERYKTYRDCGCTMGSHSV